MVKEKFSAELVHPQLLNYPGDIAPSLIIPNRRNTTSMRKYYQATLVTIALISVVCLLFYRHEYNKLRYVLEVINYFGKPGAAKPADSDCSRGNYNTYELDLRFDIPLPSWQRFNNNLFIYSAHNINQNEIRAIAFGKANLKDDIHCKVYFEGTEPAVGRFEYTEISDSYKIVAGQNLKYVGYQLFCKYSELGIPEGVSFFAGEDAYENNNPILNVKDSLQSSERSEVAVCVAPPLNRSISHLDLLSFLNYHRVIGVTHFVIYDYGIPSTFTELVRDIVNSQGLNFTFTILPWNFPFNEISHDIVKIMVEADCLHRTYNKVGYSAVLHWEEYVVLKYHHTVSELLYDLDKSLLSSDRYRLDTSVFCTQRKDVEKITDQQTAPMIFRKFDKLSEDKIESSGHVYISKPFKSINLGKSSARNAGKDLINVNRYRYCSDSESKLSYTQDKSILRFAEKMLDTPIYKQYIISKNSLVD